MASHNGHDYIEIGGIKWATMNIGAGSVTDYGQYFQWGDTTGYDASSVGPNTESYKKPFFWSDYKFGNGTSDPGGTGMTKYNASDGKTVLDLCDDAARANWGGSWRMPTLADFQALSAATTNAWTSITVDSVTVSGRQFTDKTDSSKTLFFPAAGNCVRGSMFVVGSNGYYWSNSLNTSDVVKGRYLNIDTWNCLMTDGSRFSGLAVRGVVDE